MKQKSLLIGAVSGKFIGPWIDVDPNRTWKVSDPGDLEGLPIRVVLQSPDGEQVEMESLKAQFHGFPAVRAILNGEFDRRSVSVEIEEVPPEGD